MKRGKRRGRDARCEGKRRRKRGKKTIKDASRPGRNAARNPQRERGVGRRSGRRKRRNERRKRKRERRKRRKDAAAENRRLLVDAAEADEDVEALRRADEEGSPGRRLAPGPDRPSNNDNAAIRPRIDARDPRVPEPDPIRETTAETTKNRQQRPKPPPPPSIPNPH